MKHAPSKRRPRLALFALVISVLSAGPALAHDLWANAFAETGANGAISVVTTIGWGHAPRPLSEFIPGSRISRYALIDPEGQMLDLPFDPSANASVDLRDQVDGPAGLTTLEGGDSFARRMIFDATAAQGAWRVVTAVPTALRTTWIDANGDSQAGAVYPDQITDAQRIVSSAVTTRSATAYWSHGGWSQPRPSAQITVELLPLGDLFAIAAGDSVAVQLHRDGVAVENVVGATFMAIAPSGREVLGEIDAGGRAQLTVTEPGLWILRSTHRQATDTAGPQFADFLDRIDEITFIATLAFEAKP